MRCEYGRFIFDTNTYAPLGEAVTADSTAGAPIVVLAPDRALKAASWLVK